MYVRWWNQSDTGALPCSSRPLVLLPPLCTTAPDTTGTGKLFEYNKVQYNNVFFEQRTFIITVALTGWYTHYCIILLQNVFVHSTFLIQLCVHVVIVIARTSIEGIV